MVINCGKWWYRRNNESLVTLLDLRSRSHVQGEVSLRENSSSMLETMIAF